jgi:LAO/AO transport system kinase
LENKSAYLKEMFRSNCRRLGSSISCCSSSNVIRLFSAKTDNEAYIRALFEGLVAHSRADLAKSITLIEATSVKKKQNAQMFIGMVLKHLKEKKNHSSKICLRVGITGPPGAGKSSLIEALGTFITRKVGAKLAVLTVDPSSSTTGGSILGDKVRMPELSRDARAYIRSSPNKCNLGGVARTTLETIFVCEAADFDVVLVETVGVGQAEHAIVNMVDCMILLIPPGSGDELQGIKKGIAEVADIIAVTKYDTHLKQDAVRVKSDYLSAVKYLRRKTPHWTPRVILTSSATNVGIEDLWKCLNEFKDVSLEKGELYPRRERQAKLWFWTHLKENLLDILLSDSKIKEKLSRLESQVISGYLTPGQASDMLIEDFTKRLI